ncbi:polymerase [Laguna Larga virus]|uniref:RNA-directed RNA polymerase L n=2 Tax=Orthobunyavirus TaxID=11572 RepID=A0A0U2GK49_BUNYW|nr:RNA polymerase [Bunyamwera virus]AKX73305.1 RNA polymerase [Bunyamwera virus]AKX73309.1 RNA polymerase [Bunyamwera virus]ARI46630.1 polymerase [Laguna Larga virus]
MEDQMYDQFLKRIQSAKTATVAKDISTDILEARHDYFGKELCASIGIEYKNNVLLDEIILDVVPGVNLMNYNIPNVTPDNYIWDGDFLIILDYKVSVGNDSTDITYKKYTSLILPVMDQLGIPTEIAIIRSNPVTNQINIVGENFRARYPNIPIQLDFSKFFELRKLLLDKFADDEEFLLMIAHGDFTLTAPWCMEDTPELTTHPIFNEFMGSMPPRFVNLFNESVAFSAYSAERWNSLLYNVKSQTEKDYQEFISIKSHNVFNMDGKYMKPTQIEIDRGWELMSQRISKERDIITDVNKQKPSIHFIWTKNANRRLPSATAKLIFLSNSLQSIAEPSTWTDSLKAIGKSMDIDGNVGQYENLCTERKMIARSTGKKIDNKRLEAVKIGNALVLWEQQFILANDLFKNQERQQFLKKFLGIGGHKTFKDKTSTDIELEKPKILDFNNTIILMAARAMVNKNKSFLSQNNTLENLHPIMETFSSQIKEASEDTFSILSRINKTCFWQCITDISTIMRNILAVSQYNRHNTFRVAMCANDSVYALVFPSSDIKTKRATVVFSIVCIHADKTDLMNAGALFTTLELKTKNFLSISKAIRLDKERCQRIVSSPGLFLLSALLLYNNNPEVSLMDVLNFSFYTSLSITKSMLSLTEPSRYMIMNSLAISSHVKDYIAEKFSPYTKTLFSVYMVNLIKRGCSSANEQSSKIQLRNIYLSDYDITQKGVNDERNLDSIWFPGKVNLKEYINQIYLPFYFNAKGLHEKHHVMIDLAKTVLEIEMNQRLDNLGIWSKHEKKQHVNLPILVHSLAKSLILDTSRHNHLRNRVESRNNFRRSITTISTFTSSKSCIKIGDFKEVKTKAHSSSIKNQKKICEKYRLSNPLFITEEEASLEVSHCNYEDLAAKIPNYRDYISVKVFDRLYELFKIGYLDDSPFIDQAMKMMKDHKDFSFTFFNKGQKTAKDREIFVGEFEAKMCMYVIERISKERCKLNTDEMISEPGDSKLRILEKKAEEEIRYIVEKTKDYMQKGEPTKALKLEINADMSKWSAQDVFYKYFWLIALDPILYPNEKKRMLYFMCNYMQKVLILPDDLLSNVLDQKTPYQNDLILDSTNNLSTNFVHIKRNWLQGNFNYISSYVHSCAMLVYKDIFKETMKLLDGECLVNSMVHSDDNQTSLAIIQNKLSDEVMIQFASDTFETVCLTFGCQANMKKTYITHTCKEFVSLFNLHGEPLSIYGRFLLPSVGDCAYIGPYEDLASRLSATQQSIKHGCPPSLAWVAISCSHWITHLTYNMLNDQINSPTSYLPFANRSDIPVELNGFINAPLYLISLVGLEAGNLWFLIEMLKKLIPLDKQRETIQTQCQWLTNLNNLNDSEKFKFKILRYLTLDTEVCADTTMGETSDMRSRSLLTPRKFTTPGSLNKLISYIDFKDSMSTDQYNQNLDYMLGNPELLVTKGENKEQFMASILYRYNSKRFKESLSIQNPAQLFIEQILFSHKPIIDYSSIFDKLSSLVESDIIAELPEIIGRVTFPQAYQMIYRDINQLPLDLEDIKIVYKYCILNDPLMITAANTSLLCVKGTPQSRTGLSANQMPEFRNMKLIHHSPALVLKAYSKNKTDLPGADPVELEKDLHHLNEFLDNTGIKAKIDQNIDNPPKHLTGTEITMYKIREITKLYQLCYDYIKSTEHKVKVFILPMKAYTAVDFCTLVQGNTLSDDKWYTMHYLKQILSGTVKGTIVTTSTSEQIIASECFRTLCHFADSFVEEASRLSFITEVIDNFQYKNIPVNTLYNTILGSNLRLDFIPLLFRMQALTQADLNRFDALKTNERVSWNNWQTNRSLNSGVIDLTISGYLRSIRVVGEDRTLKIAELTIPNFYPNTVFHAGNKLLNSRHGLKFEYMEECVLDEKYNYYVTFQKKRAHIYTYQVSTTEHIFRRNQEGAASRGNRYNKMVPVCPVVLSVRDELFRMSLNNVFSLNITNFSMSRLYVSPDEMATIRKAHMSKMMFFNGPDIKAGIVNLTALMRTQELLSLNYDNICKSSIVPFCRILSCNGDEDMGELIFLSDEIMDFTISEEIESMPIFTIKYQKRGHEKMTYKNAISKLVTRGVEEVTTVFDFSGDGFYSKKNLGIINTLCSVINLLETNEWSSILLNSFHIAMLLEGMDREFHMFSLPSAFFINVAGGQINWTKLLKFVRSLPKIGHEPWSIMMDRFIDKTVFLIEKELNKEANFNDFLDELEFKSGKSMFSFF